MPDGEIFRTEFAPNSATKRLPEVSKASPVGRFKPETNVLHVRSAAIFKIEFVPASDTKTLPAVSTAKPAGLATPAPNVLVYFKIESVVMSPTRRFPWRSNANAAASIFVARPRPYQLVTLERSTEHAYPL